MDVWSVTRDAATIGLVGLGITRGFLRPPGGALSWPMFASIAFTRVELSSDRDGTAVNPWEYRNHCDVAGGIPELESFLEYLWAVHAVTVGGRGVLVCGQGYFPFAVTASEIAASASG